VTDAVQPLTPIGERRIGRRASTPAPHPVPPPFVDPSRFGPSREQQQLMRRISPTGTQTPPLVLQSPEAPVDLPDPERNYEGYWWTGHRGADGPLFRALASARDVDQGGLGTCYLLADLAALAAVDPKMITDLVREDPDGNFTVTFHDGGLQREVRVDREMVWGLGRGGIGWQNASLRGDKGPELWVAVIEKAYAMAKGSYDAIDGGWPHATFEELTGRTFTQGAVSSSDQTWAALTARSPGSRSDDSTWEARLSSPAAMATPDKPEPETFWDKVGTFFKKLVGPKNGYASNHAYGILGIGQNAELGKYVIMYNPWGKFEGREDGPNDGLFRVPVTELQDHFYYVTYSREIWHFTR